MTAHCPSSLSALPNATHEVRREHWCELQNGHDNLHYTIGQASLDEAWWLRWDDHGNRREPTALPGRIAQQAGPDPEPCTLPATPSFELQIE